MKGINIFDCTEFPTNLRMSEKSFLRNLVKDSAIYGITKYVSVISAIFLTPIYTRIIPRFEYGIMDIFNIWISFCALLIPLGMIEAMPRMWADVSEKKENMRRIIGSHNVIVLGGIIVFLTFSLIGKEFYEEYVLDSDQYSSIYYLAICLICLQIFNNQQLTFFRLGFKRLAYTIVSLGNFFILTVLGFVLVYYYNMSIRGFFWASLCAFLFSAVLSSILNRKFIVFSFHLETAKEMVRYSLPLLYVVLFFSFSDLIDRFIISRYLSMEHVGLYSVGIRIASIPLFFTSAFATAWFPRIFSISDSRERIRVLISTNDLALHVFGFILFSVLLFRKELLAFFAPDYTDSLNIIVLLSLSSVINGLGPIYAVGIHLEKKSRDFVKAALVSIPLNIILSLLLVQNYGVEGVAIGTLAGSIMWTYLRYHFGQKRLKVSYRFRPLYYLLPLIILSIFASHYLDLSISNLAMKIILCIIFAALLYRKFNPDNNELV